MPSIRDVAREAGVSVATVSRALSKPEKVSAASLQRVQKAVEKMGYRPNMLARNFRSTRSYSIVVLVPDISNPFYSLVIRSLEDRAKQKGYAVLLGDTRGDVEREMEYVRRVETRLADGLVQLRPDADSLIPLDIARVNVCGCETTEAPVVRVDNRGAAKKMVTYLASLGHRRIGVISGLRENPHSIDRMAGYREGLIAAGLSFTPELVAEGDFTMWSGLSAAAYFCSLPQPPTAIFCMNDEMAFGAIQTLKGKGFRVPEDVSVAGFDDIVYARYWDPGLTTIAQPVEEMGTRAMDMLLRVMEGQSLSETECILPTEFVVRNSTGPAPAG